MLARLAENLFWAGRYVERAEDAARMVDVTYHTLLESSSAEVTAPWGQLLDVLHLRAVYGDRPVEPAAVIQFLVLDRDNPGSITTSILRARENARSVRELISSELWEAVNNLHLSLASRDLRRDLADQPYELFGMIRRACMGIYGVASETMPRDEGWRFMALGRVLERAEMTCRLIDVRYQQLEELAGPSRRLTGGDGARPRGADRADFHHWIAVLKSASAFEAYRRRYRSSMDPADVVEFLLLEPDLPRSVVFCLSGAMHQLQALSQGGPSRAVRALGRVTASLQYRDVAELFELGLHPFLDEVQERVADVSEAVADEFFRRHPSGLMHAIATT
ncbi:alpha-E domain-containing protein [Egicoccus sp. AB-alg6-2]|uniref:alpha-E domain-containing protein n=1 Tax=Egicoccus sp. AB-alg6-2 TaxID=3242692 RepID=UPI00359D8113